MEKPASLRAAITAVLPDLGRDSDRLKIWLDEGRIRSPMTASRAFSWEYKLHLVVTDYTDHPSIIFLAVNDWLRTNQPDVLAAGAGRGYSFNADILDDTTIDLVVELDLTEQVVLVPREGGGFDLQHLSEPDPLFADDMPIGETLAPLAQIYMGGEQVVP
ncbi:phage tail protein [Croceicoccus sp. BE223]|uniref:phage tail protein n=1 Tax=Croceicoccus sp. BE223 TaxID=2817716 RepID=UPI0028677EFA|nr:phage tail protein [Croceicoccus sp. BE223]MDR7101470.1 hypothetical protein [Croceicoccus sp. BE223]